MTSATSGETARPAFAPRDSEPFRPGPLMKVLAVLLVIGVFVASATWIARVFAPKPVREVRTWQEPPPQVALTPAELAAAKAMPEHPGAVVVLTYHEVSNRTEAEGAGPYTLPTDVFARQMAALDAAGYQTVSTQQVLDFVKGKGKLPPRAVLLTFDDGHATDLGVADGILARHGFRAASFVITGTVKPGGSPTYHLNVNQLRAMAASGRWEIGSHTHASHFRRQAGALPIATALDHRLTLPGGAQETMAQWRARVHGDLAASQRFLSNILGKPATAFAYPYGAYSSEKSPPGEADAIRQQLAGLLAKNGFSIAFAGAITRPEKANALGEDPYRIRRLSVQRGIDTLQLLKAMKSVVPSPVIANPLSVPWTGKDSVCAIDPKAGTLTISSRRHHVAECRPFVNSSQWQDYTTTVRVRGVTPNAWAIISVRDGAQWAQYGRVEVSIRRSYLYVKEIGPQGGRKLGGKTFLGAQPPGGHVIQIRAVGRNLSVFVNDRLALTRTTRSLVGGGVTLTVIAPQGTPLTFDRMALEPWVDPAERRRAAEAMAGQNQPYQFTPKTSTTSGPFVRFG